MKRTRYRQLLFDPRLDRCWDLDYDERSHVEKYQALWSRQSKFPSTMITVSTPTSKSLLFRAYYGALEHNWMLPKRHDGPVYLSGKEEGVWHKYDEEQQRAIKLGITGREIDTNMAIITALSPSSHDFIQIGNARQRLKDVRLPVDGIGVVPRAMLETANAFGELAVVGHRASQAFEEFGNLDYGKPELAALSEMHDKRYEEVRAYDGMTQSQSRKHEATVMKKANKISDPFKREAYIRRRL